jgi:hypothetical protein
VAGYTAFRSEARELRSRPCWISRNVSNKSDAIGSKEDGGGRGSSASFQRLPSSTTFPRWSSHTAYSAAATGTTQVSAAPASAITPIKTTCILHGAAVLAPVISTRTSRESRPSRISLIAPPFCYYSKGHNGRAHGAPRFTLLGDLRKRCISLNDTRRPPHLPQTVDSTSRLPGQ